MSKISEADAIEQMQTLTMLGETAAAMEEVRGYGLENSENAVDYGSRGPKQ
jgi:hypothetical protein